MSDDEPQNARRPGLSFSYVLVLVLFVAAVADVTILNGGFLVALGYRSHRAFLIGGTLLVALLLWWAVFRAARRAETPKSDVAVQTVRGYNWAFQPVTALVLLIAAAGIADAHSLPKLLHRFDMQATDVAGFAITGAPGPERRGCQATPAANPAYGDVNLCLPPEVAAGVDAGGGMVFVSGSWSRFGFLPESYALTGDAGPTPVEVRDPGFPDILEDIIDAIEDPEDGAPPPAEAVPPAAGGKDKNLKR